MIDKYPSEVVRGASGMTLAEAIEFCHANPDRPVVWISANQMHSLQTYRYSAADDRFESFVPSDVHAFKVWMEVHHLPVVGEFYRLEGRE